MTTKPIKIRWIFFAAILLLVLGVVLFRVSTGKAPMVKSQALNMVEMAVVTSEPLNVNIEAVGTLAANESVILRPEVAGRVLEIPFTEGAPVKKGDVLFKLDDRIMRAELKQAAANARMARLDYDRFVKLARTGAATRRLADQSQANLSVAEANADLAGAKLDYATIRAPFDGVVGLRKISPGEYVTVGQDLANFVSYDPMKVDFTIPETRSGALQVGQTINIALDALPSEIFKGQVYALNPELDVSGRAVSLRALVPNPDGRLKPGSFARIELEISQNNAALTIPEGAVIPQGDKQFVYRITPESTVMLTPVSIGQRLTGKVEITQGLAEGDRVVISGQNKLHEGAMVEIIVVKTSPEANLHAQPSDKNAPEHNADEQNADEQNTNEQNANEPTQGNK